MTPNGFCCQQKAKDLHPDKKSEKLFTAQMFYSLDGKVMNNTSALALTWKVYFSYADRCGRGSSKTSKQKLRQKRIQEHQISANFTKATIQHMKKRYGWWRELFQHTVLTLAYQSSNCGKCCVRMAALHTCMNLIGCCQSAGRRAAGELASDHEARINQLQTQHQCPVCAETQCFVLVQAQLAENEHIHDRSQLVSTYLKINVSNWNHLLVHQSVNREN